MGFYRKPLEETVPSYVEIIAKGMDLYHNDASSSYNSSSIQVKNSDGQLIYLPTSNFALTSSNTFNGDQTINGNLNVNGDINVSNIISASTIYRSGSTKFGNTSDDTHEFTGSIYLTGSIYFHTGSNTISILTGQLNWNDTDGTLELGLGTGKSTVELGQGQVARVVNKTGQNLLRNDYKIVKVRSAQGQRLSVDFAIAKSEGGSTDTLGAVREDISVNQEGYITTYGLLKEINTTGALQGETWNDGDLLFLSATTSGSFTNIAPIAPNHGVRMGYVVYAHSQHGILWVKVDNGYELDELHNVKIQNDTSGDILYKSGSVWTNTALVHIENNSVSTIILNQVSSSLNFANDTLAAAGGVPLGGLYRNGNVIQIRIV